MSTLSTNTEIGGGHPREPSTSSGINRHVDARRRPIEFAEAMEHTPTLEEFLDVYPVKATQRGQTLCAERWENLRDSDRRYAVSFIAYAASCNRMTGAPAMDPFMWIVNTWWCGTPDWKNRHLYRGRR